VCAVGLDGSKEGDEVKSSNRKKRLERRRKAFDDGKLGMQKGYKRPGSMKK
jgi:hypothetical protein